MIIRGDCLIEMARMEPNSIDAIVTDPPYGLKFMGKEWDHGIPGIHFWEAALRIAKPGCHLLAFGGTRTFHRLVCAIEDAGWEIRDCLGWIYGSGFPKSHNLKGDKVGWGTALKPAWEPIIMVRKPLDGTVAENVQKWGTGAINVDGCRVGGEKGVPASLSNAGQLGWKTGGDMERKQTQNGRWPANLLHDGSEEVMELFPETKSGAKEGFYNGWGQHGIYGKTRPYIHKSEASSGSAARFFYCAKASRKEREAGCGKNPHPTIKPLALMRYLCRLITPPGGTILDPFMGSGTTGMAAKAEGFEFLGIEIDPEYFKIAEKRIEAA